MLTFGLAAAALISAITWTIATNARTKLLIALDAAPSPESPSSIGSSSSVTSCSGREMATLQKAYSSSTFRGSFCGSTSEKSTIHSARARSSSKVMISGASTFRR